MIINDCCEICTKIFLLKLVILLCHVVLIIVIRN